MIELAIENRFDSWREAARSAYARDIAPRDVQWIDRASAQGGLFAPSFELAAPASPVQLRLPAKFVALAKVVARHSSFRKWDVLYRALWRIARGERNLLEVITDETTAELLSLRRQVMHDVHKMHAFVRFRRTKDGEGEVYVAWYEPEHDIVEIAAPFFAQRFASMRWSIFTPRVCAHWDLRELSFSAGVKRPHAPSGDELEELWRGYYAATFNAARTNVELMKLHIPSRFWKNLPEMESVPALLAEAPARVATMIEAQREAPSARSFVPAARSLAVLCEAASACRGCPLGECATRTVFGEGPENARIMLVGEQPGDEEDLRGRPFVGAAGEVLDRALLEAGLDREALYVTNAVKHFGFIERGKRRIHRTPRLIEIVACKPWLEAEVEAIAPELMVCLGATAAKSVFGAQFRLTQQRGKVLSSRFAEKTIATFHPSAVLRAADEGLQRTIYGNIVADLRTAASSFNR